MVLSKIERNDVFCIFFYYQANGFDIERRLNNNGQFRLAIDHLRIQRGWYLVKIGTVDIRGQAFDTFRHLLQYEEGKLVEWTILVDDSDFDLRYNPEIPLPKIKLFWGYCHRCGTDEEAIKKFNLRKHLGSVYVRHVKYVEHNDPERYKCQVCLVTFDRKQKFESHQCQKFKDVTNPTIYNLLEPDSDLHSTITGLSDTQIYTLCFNNKQALGNCYPRNYFMILFYLSFLLLTLNYSIGRKFAQAFRIL